jgi:GWxTD domain-containing protein
MSLRRLSFAFLPAGVFVLVGIAWASRQGVGTQPNQKAFYDMVRMIMTDDEAKVYKGLPDEKSREEFIREFWAVRDPKPETPENEAKTEFEKRARYAALWFGTQNPYKGRDPGGPLKYTGGWSDERGRVYALLGKPDTIIFFDGVHEKESRDGSRSRLEVERWILEEWIYDRLSTYAVFRRQQPDMGGGTGGQPGAWYLDSYQSNLIDVLEWAKLNWLSSEEQGDVTPWFKFSAAWGPMGIQIVVPVERVSVDDRFRVSLGVQVNVYRAGVKVDEVRLTKEIQEDRENLFENKELRFGIPYAPGQKGDYLFDIIIRDLKAATASKYRVILKQPL